jgi:hypothetical protein
MTSVQNTLKNIIEEHHTRRINSDYMENETEEELSSKILMELYVADNGGSLSSESRIFLQCNNSFRHIENIVKRIFLHGEDINIALSNELNIINEEERVLFLEPRLVAIEDRYNTIIENMGDFEERIKQTFHRKTGQLHGHLEHRDPRKEINDINQSIGLRLDHLERRVEEFILHAQLNTREIIAKALGEMLPKVVDEVNKTFIKTTKELPKRIAQISHATEQQSRVKEPITKKDSGKKITTHTSDSKNSYSRHNNHLQSAQPQQLGGFSLAQPVNYNDDDEIDDSAF